MTASGPYSPIDAAMRIRDGLTASGFTVDNDVVRQLTSIINRAYKSALATDRFPEFIHAASDFSTRIFKAADKYNRIQLDSSFMEFAMKGICPLWPFC